MKTNNISNEAEVKFLCYYRFFLQSMKNKEHTNFQKIQVLGRPARPIIYVLIAKSILVILLFQHYI